MFSIESFYKSSIKCIELIRAQILATGASTNMAYHAWDSRGQETELPNADLIGLVGWSFAENDGLPVIQAGILVSLVLDVNQFREVKIMDIIRNTFVDKTGFATMPLYDPVTGLELTQLQVSDFEIMPAGRSEIRSTRNVGVEFIRTSHDGR
jgi:hypothetical protein